DQQWRGDGFDGSQRITDPSDNLAKPLADIGSHFVVAGSVEDGRDLDDDVVFAGCGQADTEQFAALVKGAHDGPAKGHRRGPLGDGQLVLLDHSLSGASGAEDNHSDGEKRDKKAPTDYAD